MPKSREEEWLKVGMGGLGGAEAERMLVDLGRLHSFERTWRVCGSSGGGGVELGSEMQNMERQRFDFCFARAGRDWVEEMEGL